MTWRTRPGIFGGPMASKTFGRVNTTINAMPGQIIPPVRIATSWIGMTFERRFEFYADTVASRTIAGMMAHLTHRLAGPGHTVMCFSEV